MKSVRVLQVVGAMNRGGVETWLVHVLRQINSRFHIDFLVHTNQESDYDNEIRKLGSNIFPCPPPSTSLLYGRNLRRVFEAHGPYDAIHSHVHHFSGYILRIADRAGIPIRIAHSHLDTSRDESSAHFLRRSYLKLTRSWIDRHATLGLACSEKAGTALFGAGWQSSPKYRLHYCGVGHEQFAKPVDSRALREVLGIPRNAFVIGHVGRFVDFKNHSFLIDIAHELLQRGLEFRLLLVGAGPLSGAVKEKAQQLGLANHVVFAGIRGDVAQLMAGAMDVFVLPSLYEGLPLVGIEVQAAGLPFVVSDTVAPELDFVPENIERLSLKLPVSTWADTILAHCDKPAKVSKESAYESFLNSSFNLQNSIRQLEAHYDPETLCFGNQRVTECGIPIPVG